MLQNKKIGFIGAGNMGSAIAGGLLSSGSVKAENIYVTDIDAAKSAVFAGGSVTVSPDATSLAKSVDVVILAVKPQIYPVVLESLKGLTAPLYISIAAGISTKFIKGHFDGNARVVRVMPNTPALISKGMTVISSDKAEQEDLQIAKGIFESVGLVDFLPERLMDAAVAVNGSSPAYVYMMIEAMADAAVKDGIPRDTAYRLAAQSVYGSAAMVLETKQHPGSLKDGVCSPGGTTAYAVAQLEKDGFRSSIINAMAKCTKRSKELSK